MKNGTPVNRNTKSSALLAGTPRGVPAKRDLLRRHDAAVDPDVSELAFRLEGGGDASGVLAEDHWAGPCRRSVTGDAGFFADEVAVLVEAEFLAVESSE